jgi:hypothetical protein
MQRVILLYPISGTSIIPTRGVQKHGGCMSNGIRMTYEAQSSLAPPRQTRSIGCQATQQGDAAFNRRRTKGARGPAFESDLALWTDAAPKAERSPHAWTTSAASGRRPATTPARSRPTGALEAYRRAGELDPRGGANATNVGAAFPRHGDLARAAVGAEMGAELDPTSLEEQFDLGLLRARERLRRRLRRRRRGAAAPRDRRSRPSSG